MISDALRIAESDFEQIVEALDKVKTAFDFWEQFVISVADASEQFNLSEYNALFSITNDAVCAVENLDTMAVKYRRYAISPTAIPSLARSR